MNNSGSSLLEWGYIYMYNSGSSFIKIKLLCILVLLPWRWQCQTRKDWLNPRGFNGSVNLPESCDFRSHFDLINIICKPFTFYTFLSAYPFQLYQLKMKNYCLCICWIWSVSKNNNVKKVISEVYAFLYCSVPSLGYEVWKRRISQPDMGSIFHIKNQWNILIIGNWSKFCNNISFLVMH